MSGAKSKRRPSIPADVGDMRLITIRGIADGIRIKEYEEKGLTPPDDAELLRIAEGRYHSSEENGNDNHLGTAKQNR